MKRRATDLRTNMRLDLGFIRGEVKARGTVNAIGIEQCHRGLVEMRAHGDEFLRQGSAFEEAECGAGVKFDEQVLSTQYSVLSKCKNVSN